MSIGLSLHVGLNCVSASGYGGWTGDLTGCEPDARDMQRLAGSLGYKTSVLLSAKATSSAVFSAIEEAARSLSAGDAFMLTYSGHGGQVEDLNEDEEDGLDETWCLFDRQVLDDEMYAMYRRFAAGVRVFVLSDSCHSGTVLKNMPPSIMAAAMTMDNLKEAIPSDHPETVAYRIAPLRASRANFELKRDLYEAVQRVLGGDVTLDPQAGVVLISGCQDNQLSADLGTNGLFTARLLKAYQAVGPDATMQQLYKSISSRMPRDQTPKLTTVGIGGPALLDKPAFKI